MLATCCWPPQSGLSLSAAGLRASWKPIAFCLPQAFYQHCSVWFVKQNRLRKSCIVEAEPISLEVPWKHVQKAVGDLCLSTGSLSHVWPQEMLLKVRRDCYVCTVCVCVFYVWHLSFFLILSAAGLLYETMCVCMCVQRVKFKERWCYREKCWRWRGEVIMGLPVTVCVWCVHDVCAGWRVSFSSCWYRDDH